MTNTRQLLAVAVVLALLTTSGHAGLVAHWTLDADGSDATANHDGATVGSVTYGQAGATAATGLSAYFAGSGQRVDVPYSAALNPNNFTAALWAKVTGGSSYRSPITSRDNEGAGGQRGYIIYDMPSNTWEFWTGRGAAPTGWPTLAGGPVSTNQWTHLAIGHDDATETKYFWVNGNLRSTATGNQYGPNQVEDLHIGSGGDTGTQYSFVGNIDDVGLFNDALNTSAVREMMQKGVRELNYTPTILANFDAGSDVAFGDIGPAGGPATTFTKLDTGNLTPGGNGVSAQVSNGTGFTDSNAGSNGLIDDYHLDHGAQGDDQANFLITGLDTHYRYDIYVAAPDGTGFGATNIYGADYTLTHTGGDITLRATGGDGNGSWREGVNYIVFEDVIPLNDGTFPGLYTQISGQSHTGLAGIQVGQMAQIPEPATLLVWSVLAGLGVTLGWRRRTQ